MREPTFPTTQGLARFYRGVIIWPKNVYGMYSAIVRGENIAADTLAGIKSLIRERLNND